MRIQTLLLFLFILTGQVLAQEEVILGEQPGDTPGEGVITGDSGTEDAQERSRGNLLERLQRQNERSNESVQPERESSSINPSNGATTEAVDPEGRRTSLSETFTQYGRLLMQPGAGTSLSEQGLTLGPNSNWNQSISGGGLTRTYNDGHNRIVINQRAGSRNMREIMEVYCPTGRSCTTREEMAVSRFTLDTGNGVESYFQCDPNPTRETIPTPDHYGLLQGSNGRKCFQVTAAMCRQFSQRIGNIKQKAEDCQNLLGRFDDLYFSRSNMEMAYESSTAVQNYARELGFRPEDKGAVARAREGRQTARVRTNNNLGAVIRIGSLCDRLNEVNGLAGVSSEEGSDQGSAPISPISPLTTPDDASGG